jgi:hypothetical protein
MKGLIASIMTTTFALGLGADVAQAQNWTGSVSLGDVARQLNAQRAKSLRKPRVFTNDDVVALRTSSDQSAPSAAKSLSTTAKEANPGKNPAKLTGYNQTGKDWAKAMPDEMGKMYVRVEGQPKVAKISLSPVKLMPSPNLVLPGQASQGAASGPTGEWAKAKFRAGSGNTPAKGEPGPIPVTSLNPLPPPRQDIGYVERGSGRVEAIVAEGQHVGLVEETEAFVKNFHEPVPSPAEVELAQTSPPPTNLPSSSSQEADHTYSSSSAQDASGSPSAGGGVDVAVLQQPEPTPGDNGESQSEASAILQSEALADYAGNQFRAKPPETLQPPPCPVIPPSAPEGGINRSTARPLGYVEKAGGEREAIVEFRDQVYLVHEGELFAEKFRVLQVTPSSVEIVEELTEASSASPDLRRNFKGGRPPDPR